MYQPPPFTDPHEVRSAEYRREPYARALLPDGSTRDGKVTRWSPTHALHTCQLTPDGPPTQAWMPLSWLTRIPRDQSQWTDPYDLH